MEKFFEIPCVNKILTVYDDCVSIKPKGLLGFMTKGIAGERKIYYKDLTSVTFQKSSKLLSGFMEFYFAGHNAIKQGGGLFAGTNNENRITFYNKYLNEMIKVNSLIQNKIANKYKQRSNIKENNDLDAISEIKKYKELLDDGIINQAEFDAKKKQLLKL